MATITKQQPRLKFLIRVVRKQRRSPSGNHHWIAANVKVFFSKVGQTSRSRSQDKKYRVPCERSCHKEYTCAILKEPITSGLKVMAKVKVFQKSVKLQGQGQKVKYYDIMWKDLSEEIPNCNMKSISLLVSKLWPRLTFFKSRSNFNVNVTRSRIMVPVKGLVIGNTHMKYESSIFNCLKVLAKVKVFVHATNADADADTRAVTLSPRTFGSVPLKHTLEIGFGSGQFS